MVFIKIKFYLILFYQIKKIIFQIAKIINITKNLTQTMLLIYMIFT